MPSRRALATIAAVGGDSRDPTQPYAVVQVGDHRLTLLRDGVQAFPAMLEAIRSARSTICLESYIFREDLTGNLFADALIERAQAGVEVNLSYDAWGSPLSARFLERLMDGGVRFLSYNPVAISKRFTRLGSRIWRRNHRKILVVDGKVGFTGGLNIGDDYAPRAAGGDGWRDTHLRIEGPAVLELQFLFLDVWRREGGAPLDEARYRSEGRRPDPKVRIIGNHFRAERMMIRDAYYRAFSEAKERIWFTMAYFMPSRGLVRRIKKAARRGVDVRLILAGTTDIPPARYAAQGFYASLLKAGVRIFEFQGRVLHAKTAQVDGRWATIGSSNLDGLSLRVNLEANAVIEDPAFVREMDRLFLDDLAECVEMDWERYRRRPFLDKALSSLLSIFRRWL